MQRCFFAENVNLLRACHEFNANSTLQKKKNRQNRFTILGQSDIMECRWRREER